MDYHSCMNLSYHEIKKILRDNKYKGRSSLTKKKQMCLALFPITEVSQNNNSYRNDDYIFQLDQYLMKKLLLNLEIDDLKNLCVTNQDYKKICNEKSFWMEKLQQYGFLLNLKDYNYTTIRQWIDLYHKLQLTDFITNWNWIWSSHKIYSYKIRADSDISQILSKYISQPSASKTGDLSLLEYYKFGRFNVLNFTQHDYREKPFSMNYNDRWQVIYELLSNNIRIYLPYDGTAIWFDQPVDFKTVWDKYNKKRQDERLRMLNNLLAKNVDDKQKYVYSIVETIYDSPDFQYIKTSRDLSDLINYLYHYNDYSYPISKPYGDFTLAMVAGDSIYSLDIYKQNIKYSEAVDAFMKEIFNKFTHNKIKLEYCLEGFKISNNIEILYTEYNFRDDNYVQDCDYLFIIRENREESSVANY